MKNFIQPGNVLTMIAPSGGVVSGALVLIGSVFGVAATSAAEGDEFELQVGGVFDLPKTSAQAWTAGAKIYRDAATGAATTTATSNTLIGVAAKDAANPSATGTVRLNASF